MELFLFANGRQCVVNRVMRDLGPISPLAPEFPLCGGVLAPLHAKAQAQDSGDFLDVGGAGGRP